MNQARYDGYEGREWYEDEPRLPPSLGIWPLGRTYVHSSDGALNTSPSNGHAAPSRNGGAPSRNGLRAARDAYGPAHGERPYPVEDGAQRDWDGERGSGGAGGLADPGFADGDAGATPLRDRLAAPPGNGRSGEGRPALYQAGGRYRGDDWPTDSGFRRGDLGLDELGDDADLDAPPARGRRGGRDFDDPVAHGPRRDDRGFGGPDPSYEPREFRDSRRRFEAERWERLERLGAGHQPDPRDQRDPREERARAGGWTARPSSSAPPPAHGRAPGWGADTGRRNQQRPAAYDAGAGGRRETWERNLTPAARVAAVEDARLLAFLHDLVQRVRNLPSLYPRLIFLVVGYAAITSLAAAYAEKIPLPLTASLVVIPAAGIIFNMGMRYPDWGRRALVGWIAGIIATIIYDCLRLSLVEVGIWGDPIPGIGRLVLADPHANFAWGYFWRFCGNGGGMGIAYTMLPWRGWKSGVLYGTLICTGLVGLLFFFPVAQVHFFPLTPVTALGGYAGHWVYGAVLGKITSWWLPPVELGRIHGRLTARLIHPGHRPRHQRGSSASADRAAPRRGAAPRSA